MALAEKSALVIGAGGLGGPALLVLAGAGVGRVTFLDDDSVETSNLNRQPLFGEVDIGQRKAVTAVRRLRRMFPAAHIEGLDRRFDESCAAELVGAADVIVDGSDNFATKFLANDAAMRAGKPLVHGGVLQYTAQVLTVVPGKTGCLRCLFEAPPPAGVPTCAEVGILGALAGFAGSLMGAEAVRILSGLRGAYEGSLLVYEARAARSRAVPVRMRPGCAVCAAAPRGTSTGPAAEGSTILP